ncbi:hypothetical protein EAS68_10040 [Legionella jordanis]|uniref:hypothetical protein n=1 Tax=Legionella jordanis TaxID=456 RepID=UPI000EFE204B|nr:hypothetical protein [Legionella jordanis]RMX17964.1 hypothetical protein EAS68_10040 [Legionella jordanis]
MADKKVSINFLVNNHARIKARLKYEIKFLENRLHKAMGDGKHVRLKTQDAAQLSSALAIKYSELASLLQVDVKIKPKGDLRVLENNPSRYYVVIQTLKQQLSRNLSLSEELMIIHKLENYYKYLQQQLNGLQPQSIEISQRSLTGKLKAILNVNGSVEWLHAIVDLANDVGENLISCFGLISQLNQQELLGLAQYYEKSDVIFLIASLFYYKQQPHKLFKQTLHPEKLASVKNRLFMLYQFIESLHENLFHHLKQQGIAIHDYLFHEEEMPAGIKIEAEQNANVIISALKEWRLMSHAQSDEIFLANKINDLFRCYKFWFNPNRLIDTAMTLNQLSLKHTNGQAGNFNKFCLFMQELFQRLSTTDCLDLYGYFSNKDSSYLMQILSALLHDEQVISIPTPNQQQKYALERVYKTLATIMEALREELGRRYVLTEAYHHIHERKPLKPGHRNLNAIIHIMNLYCDSAVLENKTIEALFKEMGTHT